MSDISTNLSMNDMLTLNMKLLFYVIIMIIFIVCMSSCISLLSYDNQGDVYRKRMRNRRNMYQECFLNETKNTYNKDMFSYKNATLTSPTHNLIFGEAKRFIYPKLNDTNPMYILEIFANLYILNGNPFGREDIKINDLSYKHKYLVYLKNSNTNNRVNVGQLTLDGDGMYKFKLKTDDINKYAEFDEVNIVYLEAQNKERVILTGKFM